MKLDLKSYIREIPDFPKEGISYKDITTLLKDKNAFKETVKLITNEFADKGITHVLGLESRGFILGGALAYTLDAGFVPARKPGKLPAEFISETYQLEYGTDSLELHKDAFGPDDVILIHDDLLATGGTALAALKLVKQLGVKQVYFSFISNLSFIETPFKKELANYHIHTLIDY